MGWPNSTDAYRMTGLFFSDELNEALALVSQELLGILGADRCSVQLIDPQSMVVAGSKAGVSSRVEQNFGEWSGPRNRSMPYPVNDPRFSEVLKGSVITLSSSNMAASDASFEGFFKNASTLGFPLIHGGKTVATAWASVYDPQATFDPRAVEAALRAAHIGALALDCAVETQRTSEFSRRQRDAIVRGCANLLAELDVAEPPKRAEAAQQAGPDGPRLAERLTNREDEILALLALGLTNQEIAERLFVSVNTVKGHVQGLFAKLGACNRNEAVSKARAFGLV